MHIRTPLEDMLPLMLAIIIPFDIMICALYIFSLLFAPPLSTCEDFCVTLSLGVSLRNNFTFRSRQACGDRNQPPLDNIGIKLKQGLRKDKLQIVDASNATKSQHRKESLQDEKILLNAGNWLEAKIFERLTSTQEDDVAEFLKNKGLQRQSIWMMKPTPRGIPATTMKFVLFSKYFPWEKNEASVFLRTVFSNPVTRRTLKGGKISKKVTPVLRGPTTRGSSASSFKLSKAKSMRKIFGKTKAHSSTSKISRRKINKSSTKSMNLRNQTLKSTEKVVFKDVSKNKKGDLEKWLDHKLLGRLKTSTDFEELLTLKKLYRPGRADLKVSSSREISSTNRYMLEEDLDKVLFHEVDATVDSDLEKFSKSVGLVSGRTSSTLSMKFMPIGEKRKKLEQNRVKSWVKEFLLENITGLERGKRNKRGVNPIPRDSWIEAQARSRDSTKNDLEEFLISRSLMKRISQHRPKNIQSKKSTTRMTGRKSSKYIPKNESEFTNGNLSQTTENVSPNSTETVISDEELVEMIMKNRMRASTEDDLQMFLKNRGILLTDNITTNISRPREIQIGRPSEEFTTASRIPYPDLGMHQFLVSKAIQRVIDLEKLSSQNKISRKPRSATKPEKNKLICANSVKTQTTFTFVVSILQILYMDTLNGVKYLCAGAIISRNKVISSSECFYGQTASLQKVLERVYIRAGSKYWSKDGARYKITKLIHPPLINRTNRYPIVFETEYNFLDVAAMSPITVGVAPIMSSHLSGEPTMLGWYADDRLQFKFRKKFGELQAISFKVTKKSKNPDVIHAKDNKTNFCAYMSGSPLVRGYFLYGVHLATVCAKRQHYFIDLKHYSDWLDLILT